MEAALLLLDSFVMLLLAYMALRDDRRAPSQPERSLFRMKTDAGAAAPPRVKERHALSAMSLRGGRR